jgi:lipopolysaccharide transport system permease protein
LADTAASRPVVTIAPSGRWRGVDLRELWRYRELLQILVWRDLTVRYRQTLLGVLWVMAQPLFTTVFFTLVFHHVARVDADGIPYGIFALSGILPWTFMASGAQSAANSLVGNASLITKVYFPRVIIPLAAILASLVDLGVLALLLFAACVAYGFWPAGPVWLLPFALLLPLALTLGLGLWLAALNVKYRDVRVLIPFALQVWMYATPVVYPRSLVPPQWQWLVQINPAQGAVEAFRWTLVGGPAPVTPVLVTLGFAAALLVSGIVVFRAMEREFVDVI